MSIEKTQGPASFNGVEAREGQLIINYEMRNVTSTLPQPDRRWKFTDAAGHFHAYSVAPEGSGYPTLGEVLRPCDLRDHPEHGNLDFCDCVWALQCLICHEEIHPGTVVDGAARFERGRMDWRAILEDMETVPDLGTLGTVRFRLHFGIAVVTGASRQPHGNSVELTAASPLGELAS